MVVEGGVESSPPVCLDGQMQGWQGAAVALPMGARDTVVPLSTGETRDSKNKPEKGDKMNSLVGGDVQ